MKYDDYRVSHSMQGVLLGWRVVDFAFHVGIQCKELDYPSAYSMDYCTVCCALPLR